MDLKQEIILKTHIRRLLDFMLSQNGGTFLGLGEHLLRKWLREGGEDVESSYDYLRRYVEDE